MSENMEEHASHAVEMVAEKVSMLTKTPTTRRSFLKLGLGGMGTAGLYLAGCTSNQIGKSPTPVRAYYVENATGLLAGDPTLCVGCRRCEVACTDYNEGKSQPSLSRIKINRNYNFGPQGAQLGFWRAEGTFGNHRIIQETCKQCPHPVPCMDSCPYGAIEVKPPTNARFVNTDKCTGCRICQRACPWAMTTYDETTKKASKCHLCFGNPECVKACPTGALRYIPWEDRTKVSPPRFVVPASLEVPKDVKDSCVDCH